MPDANRIALQHEARLISQQIAYTVTTGGVRGISYSVNLRRARMNLFVAANPDIVKEFRLRTRPLAGAKPGANFLGLHRKRLETAANLLGFDSSAFDAQRLNIILVEPGWIGPTDGCVLAPPAPAT